MFAIVAPYLNLDQIYNSRQCYRWIKIRDGKYMIPDGNTVVRAEQNDDRIILSCTEEQFFKHWYYYFALGNDYIEINRQIKHIGNYLKVCANRCAGVRMIKQDLFESIITAYITHGLSFHKAQYIVNRLCELLGKRHGGSVKWYEFPGAQQFLASRKLLTLCGLGDKVDTVINICGNINIGLLDLSALSTMHYSQAKAYLMQFEGINESVANYICLHGLGFLEAFSDTEHIAKILMQEFNCDFETFVEWYLSGYEQLAGVIMQYLIFNDYNPPKELEVWA